jgi:hypothetical protein
MNNPPKAHKIKKPFRYISAEESKRAGYLAARLKEYAARVQKSEWASRVPGQNESVMTSPCVQVIVR